MVALRRRASWALAGWIVGYALFLWTLAGCASAPASEPVAPRPWSPVLMNTGSSAYRMAPGGQVQTGPYIIPDTGGAAW